MYTMIDRINNIKETQRTIDKLLELNEMKIKEKGEIETGGTVLNTIYEKDEYQIGIGYHCKAGSYIPMHCHKGVIEYLIVGKGKILVQFENSAVRVLDRGECASIKPNRLHSVKALEDETEVIFVCIPPERGYSKCQKV